MRRKEFNQEDERIDDLNIKDYKIIQNKSSFVLEWMQYLSLLQR